MALLDEFRAESNWTTSPSCWMAQLIDSMPPEDAEALRTALADDQGVTGEAIAKVMRRHGWQISATTVRRHRRGECSCGPR